MVHINLRNGKPYLHSLADAIATLSDEAGFQSGEIVTLTALLFERSNRHVYSVSLRNSKTCRARHRSVGFA